MRVQVRWFPAVSVMVIARVAIGQAVLVVFVCECRHAELVTIDGRDKAGTKP